MLHPLILILSFYTALAQTPDPASASLIRAVRQQIDAAFQQHDARQSAAFFTPDCRFTAPTHHIDSSDDLQRFYTSLFARRPDVTLSHHVKDIAVNEAWDLASAHGEWVEQWTEKDGVTELRGTYLAMWKRVDGTWREYSEMIVPETCTGGTYCKK